MTTAVTRTEFTTLKEEVEDHDHFINGNGKPGAKEKFATIDGRFDGLEERLDKLQKTLDRRDGWFVAFVATFVGAFLIWLFTSILPALLRIIN